MDEILHATKAFLRKAFVRNPSFSFNDWRIMYNHSLNVLAFSLKIAEKISCDTFVVAIGALLHDVGKTLKIDEQILRNKHGELAYIASRSFLNSLALTRTQRAQLKKILSNRGTSREKKILEDADIIAFFADKKLQEAFKNWVDQKALYGELQRKIDKVEKLHFDVSKKIAKPFYEKLKKQWAPIDCFTGKRVTVMGLGLHGGGTATAVWLVRHGAIVTVTDLRNRAELRASLQQLHLKFQISNPPAGGQFQIRFVLGHHRKEDFINTDMVVRNPAVPVESPFLKVARAHGVPIENEATLFFKHCRSKNIIGVTGTRGKSTTCAMIAAILKAYRGQGTGDRGRVWLAGNIRTTPMLSIVDRIKPNDWVVLELSSWHLEDMDRQKISPHIAVVTNVLQDHLNRYAGMRSYARAKESILRYQKKGDIAVLNKENPWTRAMAKKTRAKVYWYTNSEFRIQNSELIGAHMQENARAAYTVARTLDIPVIVIRHALRSFRGLPDRLEFVRTVRGIKYYNDTTATTPDATMFALRVFASKPIVLIAGGSDKNLNYKPLIPWIKKTCKAVILLPGTATEKIKKLLHVTCYMLHVYEAPTMPVAIRAAVQRATRGDIILLSPAAASFAIFQHEFDRGDQFRRVVKKLTA